MKKESLLKKLGLFCIASVMCCFALSCKNSTDRKQGVWNGDRLGKVTSVEYYSKASIYIVCVYDYEYMVRSQGGIIMLIKNGKPAKCQ